MRHFRRSLVSPKVAFVAAWMLIVQALVGAFALGAMANADPLLDAFGNPLCITSSDRSALSDEAGHTALPECCTAACGMFAPLTVEDRTPHSLDNPLPARTRASHTFDTVDLRPLADHNPGNPRAPPATG